MANGTFRADRRNKYDMPVGFGPTEMPEVSVWGQVEMVSTSFATTAEAVGRYLPAAFDLPAEPVVTFSRMTYTDVDYLGGRGYNELTVGVTAGITIDGTTRRGSYMLVVWVDDVRAIIVGREYMGYPKLGAELPPVERSAGRLRYAVSEYGAPLYQAEVGDLEALSGPELAAARRAASSVTVFGWKHIASPHGTPDADYPTLIALSFDWESVARARASGTISTPAHQDAPHSARVMKALGELPVLRQRPAVVATGTGTIDRSKVRRIDYARPGGNPRPRDTITTPTHARAARAADPAPDHAR